MLNKNTKVIVHYLKYEILTGSITINLMYIVVTKTIYVFKLLIYKLIYPKKYSSFS